MLVGVTRDEPRTRRPARPPLPRRRWRRSRRVGTRLRAAVRGEAWRDAAAICPARAELDCALRRAIATLETRSASGSRRSSRRTRACGELLAFRETPRRRSCSRAASSAGTPTGLSRTLTIDRGERDGVAAGAAVLAPGGSRRPGLPGEPARGPRAAASRTTTAASTRSCSARGPAASSRARRRALRPQVREARPRICRSATCVVTSGLDGIFPRGLADRPASSQCRQARAGPLPVRRGRAGVDFEAARRGAGHARDPWPSADRRPRQPARPGRRRDAVRHRPWRSPGAAPVAMLLQTTLVPRRCCRTVAIVPNLVLILASTWGCTPSRRRRRHRGLRARLPSRHVLRHAARRARLRLHGGRIVRGVPDRADALDRGRRARDDAWCSSPRCVHTVRGVRRGGAGVDARRGPRWAVVLRHGRRCRRSVAARRHAMAVRGSCVRSAAMLRLAGWRRLERRADDPLGAARGAAGAGAAHRASRRPSCSLAFSADRRAALVRCRWCTGDEMRVVVGEQPHPPACACRRRAASSTTATARSLIDNRRRSTSCSCPRTRRDPEASRRWPAAWPSARRDGDAAPRAAARAVEAAAVRGHRRAARSRLGATSSRSRRISSSCRACRCGRAAPALPVSVRWRRTSSATSAR